MYLLTVEIWKYSFLSFIFFLQKSFGSDFAFAESFPFYLSLHGTIQMHIRGFTIFFRISLHSQFWSYLLSLWCGVLVTDGRTWAAHSNSEKSTDIRRKKNKLVGENQIIYLNLHSPYQKKKIAQYIYIHIYIDLCNSSYRRAH